MKMVNDYFINPHAKKDLKVLYGLLTPTDWDERDTPIEFSLDSTEEEDIPIKAPHLKRKLLKYCNRPVEVIGSLHTDAFGDQYIHVRKIRRLNPLIFERMIRKNHFTHDEYTPIIDQAAFEQVAV